MIIIYGQVHYAINRWFEQWVLQLRRSTTRTNVQIWVAGYQLHIVSWQCVSGATIYRCILCIMAYDKLTINVKRRKLKPKLL